MNFNTLWLNLFGTTELLGVNLGFWAAMLICLLVVVLMNAVLWGIKPKAQPSKTSARRDERARRQL